MPTQRIFIRFAITAATLLWFTTCLVAQQSTIRELLNVIEKGTGDTNHVNQLNLLSQTEGWQKENFDTAIYFAEQARALAEKINFKKGLGAAHRNLGIAFVSIADYQQALKNHKECLKIFTELGDKNMAASAMGNIGNVYWFVSRHGEALKYYFAALKVKEQLQDTGGIVSVRTMIGSVYFANQNYDESLKNHLIAKQLLQGKDDEQRLALTYGNIGNILAVRERYTEALSYYQSGLEIYEKYMNKGGIANTLNNIGGLYIKSGLDRAKGLKYYLRAEKLAEEMGDKTSVSVYSHNIGTFYLESGDLETGKSWLEKSISIAEEIRDINRMSISYEMLAQAAVQMKDWKRAFEHYKLYILYRDSLASEQNTRQIVQQQMQYDFDKKEAEAKALQAKKDAIAAEEARRQKIVLGCVIAGLVLVLLFAIFIFRQYRQKKIANFKITLQKEIIEKKQQEILDSIYYARRIQRSLLTSEKYIQRRLASLLKKG